jgi:hypothetical protein
MWLRSTKRPCGAFRYDKRPIRSYRSFPPVGPRRGSIRACLKILYFTPHDTSIDHDVHLATAAALPPSGWMHVASTECEGHWIPAEGKVVETLIGDLLRQGVSTGDIFLMSPFRVVVRRLRQIASRFGIKAGTVHTAQGKESDVVILVLGGDPRRPRAKQWASKRPNLLNVAVSRAKRRLYVVGNQEAWKRYRYFGMCVAVLQQWNGTGSVTA